ncbi:Type I transmembrane sorting receptor [Arthrobotrys megalospora]
MHHTFFFLSIFTSRILAAPLSIPEGSQTSDGGFSVPIVHNYSEKRDPFYALYHAYQRYGHGMAMPGELLEFSKHLEVKPLNKNHRRADAASVSSTPTGLDVEYWSPVKIGKNRLNLNFDTGSNALWVFSSVTPANQRGSHNLYFPGITSLKKNGYSWGITYADNSKASGVVFMDTVQVGSATVTSQAVQAATAVSENFVKNSAIDGLFGLGYAKVNNVSPERSGTWFANAMKTLKSGVFTADLRPGAVGAYTFGYIDPSKYSGSITYQPLHSNAASKGWWLVDASKGYKIGNEQFSDNSGSNNGAVLDTGTTLLLMSDEVTKNYYSKVTGSQYAPSRGGWVYPCASSLPDLQVPFGSAFAKIPSKYMTHTTLDSKNELCFGSLQSLGTTNSHLPYIYGDIFFKANYAIFDMKNGKVGFATKKN